MILIKELTNIYDALGRNTCELIKTNIINYVWNSFSSANRWGNIMFI